MKLADSCLSYVLDGFRASFRAAVAIGLVVHVASAATVQGSGLSWTFTGSQEGEWAGSSLAILGDTNGDGFADLLIGSPGHDSAAPEAGKVSFFPGSESGLPVSPSWTWSSDVPGEGVGFAVAAAGDLNSDGFADALVGASGSPGAGAVYVFMGSAMGFPSVPTFTVAGDQADAGFGSALAGAGDVNGDGFGDVLVAAPGFDGTEIDKGKVSLYLGSSAGLGSSPAWTQEGVQAGMRLGSSVCSAGDVNGDGYADVAIGAFDFDSNEADAGYVALYLGTPAGLASTPSWTLVGTQHEEEVGRAIVSPGDMNGDGYGELAVGAPRHTTSVGGQGAVMVFMGSATGLSSSCDQTLLGEEDLEFLGAALAFVGDANADGFPDLFVGAPGSTMGRAYFFLGGATIAASPAAVLPGLQDFVGYGKSIASGGDVNGDGYCDLFVGAAQLDAEFPAVGRVYGYFGGAQAPRTLPDKNLLAPFYESGFGNSTANAGDVNADGFSDLLVGAYMQSTQHYEAGCAYVFFGSASGLQDQPSWSFDGDRESMQLGRSVSGAGDVNGDGFADILVGAWSYSGLFNSQGAVFVFHGSATGPASTPSWAMYGTKAEDNFGWSVSKAGDVNGDGYGDVIIGADQAGSDVEGMAYLFLGSASGLASSPAWTFEGNQEGAGLGGMVADAGDVNGDGFSDVLVDAYGFDVPGTPDENKGRIHLFLGRSSGLSPGAVWYKDGAREAMNYGVFATSPGDLNGDGFSDVAVGALGYAPSEVHVYHGSPQGLAAVPNSTIICDQVAGLQVASAGDLNGDGFGDLLVGYPLYTMNLIYQGRAHAFFGSETGIEATPRWTSDGDTQQGVFGNALSAADVNGDGYSDCFVSSAGKVALFSGNGSSSPDLIASQHSPSGQTIDVLGRSDSLRSFRLMATYVRPEGFTPLAEGPPVTAWLEWEIVSQDHAFDGRPEGRSGPLVLTAGPNLFDEPIAGLFGGVLYSWRARVVTDSPLLPPTPWYSLQGRSATDPEFRIGLSKLRPR